MGLNLDDFEFRWVPGTDTYELIHQGTKWGNITASDENGRRTILGLTQDQRDTLNDGSVMGYRRFADHAQAIIVAHMVFRKTAEDAAYYTGLTEDA